MSLLPDTNEIEEDVRNNPEKYKEKKREREAKSPKRKRRSEWISDYEREQFLSDHTWNDFSSESTESMSNPHKNQSKFEELKSSLSNEKFEEMLDLAILFVERCIPKPLSTITFRGIYNGWMISAMPGDYGYLGITAGAHYVANIDIEGNFNIYIREKDIKEQFGFVSKLQSEFPEASVGAADGSETGKEHELMCLTIKMCDVKKALNDSRIILASRAFVELLMEQCQTIHHPHQCEPLVTEILGRIAKKHDIV